jgi:catechol-2,3-dioxygenase
LDIGGKAGLHHLSFELDDFHQVVVAGEKLRRRGWKTSMGLGRHMIGSNYFWYFEAPCGGSIEYYSDMDRATEEWPVRTWDYSPAIAAVWTANIDFR